jgi:hypothetical protein
MKYFLLFSSLVNLIKSTLDKRVGSQKYSKKSI